MQKQSTKVSKESEDKPHKSIFNKRFLKTVALYSALTVAVTATSIGLVNAIKNSQATYEKQKQTMISQGIMNFDAWYLLNNNETPNYSFSIKEMNQLTNTVKKYNLDPDIWDYPEIKLVQIIQDHSFDVRTKKKAEERLKQQGLFDYQIKELEIIIEICNNLSDWESIISKVPKNNSILHGILGEDI